MALRFEVFAETHLPAMREFNRRMTDAHAPSDFLLPTEMERPRNTGDNPIRWTRYNALDGEFVRGGVLAMEQPGWLNGQETRAVNFQSPLSEGIADPKYSIVAMQMVKFMQKQAEAVFMVGMGAIDRPLPKLLMASGWTVRPIPFLFRVHSAGRFLSELQMLRTSAAKRIAATTARITGLGAVGLAFKQRTRAQVRGTVREVPTWGEWADDVWLQCRESCSFAVKRDRKTLESLYPLEDERTRLFVIERNGQAIGWSVCFNAALTNHRHFGSLQVGTVLDCMAAPDAMATTAILTDRELGSMNADLVVANHSHARWVEAFHAAGFLDGPSNYMLGMSKKLTEAIREMPDGEAKVHVTRGDGDGRINLG